MRVLWITQVYPRHERDSFGAFLHRLARELPPRGVEVTVLAPGDANAPDRETRDGVEIVRAPAATTSRPRIAYTGEMHRAALRHPIAFVRFFSEFASAAKKCFRDVAPDIVHSHWWFPSGWIASKTVSPGTPRVLSMHGTDVRLLGSLPGAKFAARRAIESAQLALPVSEFLRRRLASEGIHPRRVEVLSMPADDACFAKEGASEPGRGFVVAGRLVSQKRVGLVLEAWKLACEAGVSVPLHVAGDGPDRMKLESQARRLGVADSVVFHGAVDPEALARMFRGATASILVSREEGFGLVVVEAGLCGTPSIVLQSGAPADLVDHGVTGWVVEDARAPAVARAILEAMNHPEVTRARGAAAQEKLSRYTPARTGERLANLYSSLVGRVGQNRKG